MKPIFESFVREIGETEEWRKHDIDPELDRAHQQYPAESDEQYREKECRDQSNSKIACQTSEVRYTRLSIFLYSFPISNNWLAVDIFDYITSHRKFRQCSILNLENIIRIDHDDKKWTRVIICDKLCRRDTIWFVTIGSTDTAGVIICISLTRAKAQMSWDSPLMKYAFFIWISFIASLELRYRTHRYGEDRCNCLV